MTRNNGSTVIVSAVRTPFGKFGGGLKGFSAVDLGALVIREVVRRAGIEGRTVDEAIMGLVVGAGCGQIPSRQAAMRAGLPVEVRSTTVNKVCASGMKAITMGDQAIRLGEAGVIVAGGMESMSNAPYLAPTARWGARLGHAQLLDAMIHDGLWCAFGDVHMAVHGSNVAREFDISREQQDQWACRSHARAARAYDQGLFQDEVLPVTIKEKKQETVIARDETIRGDSTVEALAKLKPVFTEDGTITAGNAPGVNDGAAATLLMSEARAAELGLQPLARIVAHDAVAEEPPYLATVPALAIKKLLMKTGMNLKDFEVIEINEAFAAVTLTSMKLLGLGDDDGERVNPNGGAVAMGHPIGASGARLVATLAYELKRRGARYGAAAICSGAAQGDAIILENLQR